MNLVEVLARELKSWPIDFQHALLTQSVGGRVSYVVNNKERWTAGNGFTRADDWVSAIVSRTEWVAAVEALNKPEIVDWDGLGIPPVGTVCNCTFRGSSQGKVRVEFVGKNACVLLNLEHGDEQCGMIYDYTFNQIITAEQVAARARRSGIEDLAKQLQPNTECPSTYVWELAQKTYDLGYRKPE